MSATSANPRERIGWVAAGIAVVLAFLTIGLVLDALAPSPSGPSLSSYATAPDGVAAWSELLIQAGHPVRQQRAAVSAQTPPAGSTLIVLGARSLSAAAHHRLTAFERAGGRAVIGGGRAARVLAAQLSPGSPPARAVSRAVGAGRLIVLADAVALENRRLADGGNAARALALAGPARRPVVFAEGIHGFGPASGLAAFPAQWWVGIVLLALAAGAWMLARGRRLGGADPIPAVVPSPRSAYLDAVAAALARTHDTEALATLAAPAHARGAGRTRSPLP